MISMLPYARARARFFRATICSGCNKKKETKVRAQCGEIKGQKAVMITA